MLFCFLTDLICFFLLFAFRWQLWWDVVQSWCWTERMFVPWWMVMMRLAKDGCYVGPMKGDCMSTSQYTTHPSFPHKNTISRAMFISVVRLIGCRYHYLGFCHRSTGKVNLTRINDNFSLICNSTISTSTQSKQSGSNKWQVCFL